MQEVLGGLTILGKIDPEVGEGFGVHKFGGEDRFARSEHSMEEENPPLAPLSEIGNEVFPVQGFFQNRREKGVLPPHKAFFRHNTRLLYHRTPIFGKYYRYVVDILEA
jgi:hypothetical protein